MINNLLKQLKFSEKEEKIYLALLELCDAKAQDISKKSDINRTTVYDVLESLMKKGLISKFKRGSSTIYNALDPKKLLNYLDREKEEKIKKIDKQKEIVNSLLPQLISLQNINTSKPKVQLFEGEKGMREAYEDTLNTKNMILAYANVETMHKGLPNFFPEYYKRRVKKKIYIKAILPKNKLSIERARRNQEEMRAARFLPDDKMSFSPEINLYNNKMLIASWNEKMAVLIESKELVDLQKMIFELLWNGLEKNL